MPEGGRIASMGFRPRNHRRRLMLGCLLCFDMGATFLAGAAASLIRFRQANPYVHLSGINVQTSYQIVAILLALAIPAFLLTEHLYDLDTLFWGSGEYSRVIHGVSIAAAGIVISSYLLKIDNLSRIWLVLWWSLAVLTITIGRWGFRAALREARRRDHMLRPTVIVGANRDARRIARSLAFDHTSGLRVVGSLTADPDEVIEGAQLIPGVPLLGDTNDVAEKVRRLGCDAVVIVSSAFEHSAVSAIVSDLRRMPVDVHVSSGLFDVLTARVIVRETAGTPIMLVKGTTLSARKLLQKRTFDLVFSSIFVILGLPLSLLIAAAIKIDSRGPVFYRQKRIGRNGVPFSMLKFRSMYADAEARLAELRVWNDADGPLFKMRKDTRVTRVGRFLRRYSIDEFPQLLNVLLGNMSLVGPRPPLPIETEQYSEHDTRRLLVLPGMTGLWQVSGRSDLTFDEMVRLDLFYIENWTLRYDVALIMRTIPKVLLADGAY